MFEQKSFIVMWRQCVKKDITFPTVSVSPELNNTITFCRIVSGLSFSFLFFFVYVFERRGISTSFCHLVSSLVVETNIAFKQRL